MITDWTSPDGLRVFGKLTIEWGDGPNRYRLNYRPEMGGWGCARLIRGEWCYYRNISPDIALSLIQKDARERLNQRGVAISTAFDTVTGLEWRAHHMDTLDRLTNTVRDYDQALIAAILAVGETQ